MTPEQAEKIISLIEAIDAKLGAPSNLAPNPNLDNPAPAPAPGETFTMVVGAP